jgi:nicotinamide riboside transporter PnuC
MDWIMALKVPDGSAGALVSVGHLQALVGLLAVFLFGLRTRWAWPVLLVQQAMVFLLLVIPNFDGGAAFFVNASIAVALFLPCYGAWRWRAAALPVDPEDPGAALAAVQVRRATGRNWGVALLILAAATLLFMASDVQAGFPLEGGLLTVLVLQALYAAVVVVVYLGLAHRIYEAWWLWLAFAVVQLATSLVFPSPPTSQLLNGATVLLVLFAFWRWHTVVYYPPVPGAEAAGDAAGGAPATSPPV